MIQQSTRLDTLAFADAKAKKALIGTLITLALIAAVIPWQRLITKWTQG